MTTRPDLPGRRGARRMVEPVIPAHRPAEAAPSPDANPAAILTARQALEEAASGIDRTLRRGASSEGIARYRHTAAGFYGPTGALIVGGWESHPLLLESAAEALALLGARRASRGRPFAAGQVFWTNDPRCGAAGLEDLILAGPIVRGERLVGFVAVSAAHTGLGRATLAPSAGLRREGVVLPWVRVGEVGGLQAGLRDLAAANVEEPAQFLEDLQVQLTVLSHGLEAAEAVLDQEGDGALTAVAEAAGRGWKRTFGRVMAGAGMPALEGRMGPFSVRIAADGPETAAVITVAAEGEHGQLTAAMARAAVRAAVRHVLAAEVPAGVMLGGAWDAVRIETPWEGEAAGLTTGAARFNEAQLLQDAVLAAFAEQMPHLVHAPDAGPILLDVRGAREDGRRYRIRLGMGAGTGASVFGDGLTHSAPPFFPLSLDAVEEIERAVPLRIRSFRMLPDSGGPGQYHGGLGARLEVALTDGRAEADVLLPGRAMGFRGGMRGAPARLVRVSEAEGTREEVGPAQVSLHLTAGDRLILESPGGGGWGIPYQRSIMRLEDDLAQGLVTPAQSQNRYGLVLKPDTLEKDDHLTYRVRHYLLTTLTAEDIIAGEVLLEE